LVLLQRAGSLCPFLPMLDLFLGQVQASAQKVGADVVTADVAPPASHLEEGLLPTAWVEAAGPGCQEQSMLLHFGVELEARLAQVRCGHEGSEVSLAHCQMLETLASAWAEGQDLPRPLHQYAAGVISLLQAYLSTAQEVHLALSDDSGSKHSQVSTVPTIVIDHDSIVEMAEQFNDSGWVYLQQLGMDKKILEQVHMDLHHVDLDMEQGELQAGCQAASHPFGMTRFFG